MSVNILMPKLGITIFSGNVVEWKVKEGDEIKSGEPVVTVETEKISNDIEAEISGFVHILVEEGNEIGVGAVIGVLAESKEELKSFQDGKIPEVSTPVQGEAEVSKETISTDVQSTSSTIPDSKEGSEGRIRISPVARKMAEENLIDITKITGTGPGGRIVKEDVEKAIAAKTGPVDKATDTTETYGTRRIRSSAPLKGMRKAIATHLQKSLAVSAQLTAIGEIDMTEMIKLREMLLSQEKTIGSRITYTDLLVYIVAKVLGRMPTINSSIIDNMVTIWDSINIGVAVALDEGLIVPVVKDVDKKTLAEISQTIKSLSGKAKEGTLQPDDVTGGTFTITNLGAAGAGWRFETAIINQPESAILGTGGITERAMVRNGQIVIRPILTYSFTYDHRLIDGALAVKFMAEVIHLLENPALIIV